MKHILILGAGFGGLTAANLLRKSLPSEHQITVIDKKQFFMMGLVNLWILSGIRKLQDSQISLNKLSDKGIKFLNDEITKLDVSNHSVTTKLKGKIEYDYLIIALGSELAPEQIDGFIDNRGINLYDGEQVSELRQRILSLRKGRIVICVTSIPYKCPPAPYEASLLINEILVKNGTRDHIGIDLYMPTPIALPVAGPKVSQEVVNLINNNHINFYPLHKLKAVLNKDTIEFENGSKVGYDLLIGIPPHKASAVVRNSGIIKEGQNWISVDKLNLKIDHYNDVFAIGDISEIKVDGTTTLPKAGIFAEGQAKVVSQEIIDEITKGSRHNAKFDGKGFCFMEIGGKKAGYLAADFYNENGPNTRLEPPTEESYTKKLDFERTRINEWLLQR
jgi:sulfide:quinone oxidoreductase